MPVTPTYPGVYIEELPSTNHTIVGVATSITAFVGYTKRGPVDQALEVFSFGDFERAFGNLDPDCPLTYAVQQFFLNGGSDAFVVRVAQGAIPAKLELRNGLTNAVTVVPVLHLEASSAGVWGNALEVTIDQDTINPVSLFNLTVTEFVASGGKMVRGRQESFRNLTMNSAAPTYAVDTIVHNSQLLTAARGSGIPTTMPSRGTSVSGPLPANVTVTATANVVVLSVNGQAPSSLTIPPGTYTRANLVNEIVSLATAAGQPLTGTTPGTSPNPMTFTETDTSLGAPTEHSSVHFTASGVHDATQALSLGVAAGGTETDAISTFHPIPTGTTGKFLGAFDVTTLNGAPHSVSVSVTVGTTAAGSADVKLTDATTVLTTTEDLRARLQAAIQAASLSNPAIADELGGATVALIANRLVVTPGGRPDAQMTIVASGADATTAPAIGFDGSAAVVINVAEYSPAIAAPLLGQGMSANGADGSAPLTADIQGDPALKTGIYALENVDLFNLLVLPDKVATDSAAVAATAMTYCEQRRAMMIVDLPTDKTALAAAQAWIKDPSTPKSANAAAYFPRALFPDPMQGYRPRKMPTAGAIAGLYARTDAARGVWKAPAGTAATLRGPAALEVPLTDMENGTINPLGLNANRALPVYGFVAWGSRTLLGADVMTSQWKYVPVRRTALYIEESLFRGTKWVVFEPNDEPLWAQIRLSVGAFMHGLFRQGAFQGASPRQAYLVKCDSETTTQSDIDQGIVNILVGFAPLKPAEFVVIQITQLAGQVES